MVTTPPVSVHLRSKTNKRRTALRSLALAAGDAAHAQQRGCTLAAPLRKSVEAATAEVGSGQVGVVHVVQRQLGDGPRVLVHQGGDVEREGTCNWAGGTITAAAR